MLKDADEVRHRWRVSEHGLEVGEALVFVAHVELHVVKALLHFEVIVIGFAIKDIDLEANLLVRTL